MVIRLNEKYRGPAPRDRLYDAVKASMSYGIVNEGEVWCVSHDCADEVDEFEEEFKKTCYEYPHSKVAFAVRDYGYGGQSSLFVLRLDDDLFYKEEGQGSVHICEAKEIPALILALLKLMED